MIINVIYRVFIKKRNNMIMLINTILSRMNVKVSSVKSQLININNQFRNKKVKITQYKNQFREFNIQNRINNKSSYQKKLMLYKITYSFWNKNIKTLILSI